jgi:hypothetical protein
MSWRDITNTQGAQIFNVPNDKDGLAFIKQMKAYKKDGVKLTKRTRGSREHPEDNQRDLAAERAEWFAMYIEDTANEDYKDGVIKDLESRNYKQRQQMWAYEEQIEDLHRQLAELEIKTDADRVNEILADKYSGLVGMLAEVAKDIKIIGE